MSYVLHVEDDDMNRMIVEDMVEFDDFPTRFVSVGSGEEAVEKATEEMPLLILMDIGLPGIDGLEATRRIRALPNSDTATIWALTAHAMKGDKDRTLEAGCDLHVTKPIEYKAFKARLYEFLEGIDAERSRSI